MISFDGRRAAGVEKAMCAHVEAALILIVDSDCINKLVKPSVSRAQALYTQTYACTLHGLSCMPESKDAVTPPSF